MIGLIFALAFMLLLMTSLLVYDFRETWIETDKEITESFGRTENVFPKFTFKVEPLFPERQ